MSMNNKHRDLSADNLLPLMLDEREKISLLIANAERRLLEINDNVKSIMGDAETATLPGWSIIWKEYTRGEFVMPETKLRPLHIKRVSED
jgi:predicted phage-related endonuclease